MTYVLSCPCSHRIARHGEGGCTGTDMKGCPCRLDRADALYAAIDASRGPDTRAPLGGPPG